MAEREEEVREQKEQQVAPLHQVWNRGWSSSSQPSWVLTSLLVERQVTVLLRALKRLALLSSGPIDYQEDSLQLSPMHIISHCLH